MTVCGLGGAFSAHAAVMIMWFVPGVGRLVLDPGYFTLLLVFCGVACLPAGALLTGRTSETIAMVVAAPIMAAILHFVVTHYRPTIPSLALLPVGIVWLLALRCHGIPRLGRVNDRTCARCRYDLTGNDSGTCPECGADPVARCESLERRRPLPLAVLLIMLLVTPPALAAAVKVAPRAQQQLIRVRASWVSPWTSPGA